MGDERRSSANGGRGLPFRLALLFGLVALVIVGCVFIESILNGRTMPTPSEPFATGSQPASPTSVSPPPTPASSTPPLTPQPPTLPGVVGDYRCLTLAIATAAIERDGYVVGTVSNSIEGGAVDATWLVDTQDPPPAAAAAPGTTIDLLFANPFNVCRSTNTPG